MEAKAYAKINLTLDVVGKRNDGYHELEMIMQSIDLYDTIKIDILDEEKIILESDVDFIPLDESNIAFKAAMRFFEESGIKKGCKIFITKRIPMSAGLAGGSTDGACVLRMLNEHFDNVLSDDKVHEIATKLGADVPFCLYGGTALCCGIGEIITPLKDFQNHTVVLVKPPFGVSTKEVFTKFNMERTKIHPETDEMIKAIIANDLPKVSSLLKNVLENVTANKHKIIKSIKEQFLECRALGTIMSGSGPTVYGLFDNDKFANDAMKHFSKKYRSIYKIKTIGKY